MKRKKVQRYPAVGDIVLVEWLDASSSRDMDDPGDDQIGIECISVGFLVYKSKAGLRLSMEVGVDGSDPRFLMDIPARMVRDIRRLR